ALACVTMFDTGTLDVSPGELTNVFAVSSGNSIYAVSPLLTDPYDDCRKFELTHLIGNIGRAGVAMMIPPTNPRIFKPGLETWNLINHSRFDRTCEDYFSKTSMHLSFTGYEQPVASAISLGAQDLEACYMEALVSVYDGSKWVADLDVMTGLTSSKIDRLTWISPQRRCSHNVTEPPSWVSIDSWDELVEMTAGCNIVRAHGNSLARLAAAVVSVQKDVEACYLAPAEVCYACV
ncbi:hypothetical protein GQ53DRAFT_620810, partial [Thozetella sp. PMI_491]